MALGDVIFYRFLMTGLFFDGMKDRDFVDTGGLQAIVIAGRGEKGPGLRARHSGASEDAK
jgi:hypothetical protein